MKYPAFLLGMLVRQSRRSDPVFLILTLHLVLLGWTSTAAVPPAFFSSPAGRDIQRGSVAADNCSLQIRQSAQAYESCGVDRQCSSAGLYDRA